ncbi:MAG: hypothetical protein OSB03_03495 [Vicinamibacterales bacterium]|jgi:hypothetical protein|nr:hypothetical protein [Vicinamibacterales bacterium]
MVCTRSVRHGTRFSGWHLTLLLGALAIPGVADAQQVIGVSVGTFAAASESSRSPSDVIKARFQAFDLGDLNNVVVGGDWMLAFGEYLEAGAGLEFYQKTVSGTLPLSPPPSDVELALDMTVRTISVPITARFFPLTRNARVQPYVGGGATIHFWRYTEDSTLNLGTLSSQSSVIDQGITLGPVVFGGARVPVGPAVSIGGEVRYRIREARLTAPVFPGTTLDLGGLSTVATVQFRIP